MKQTKRIEYLDAMRGLTMLFVVCGHVYTFSCGLSHSDNFSFTTITSTLELPLFFFISGFVCPLTPIWKQLHHKARQLLMPAFVFMVFHHWVFNYNLEYGLANAYKMGYWFTVVLFEFYVFYAIYQLFSYKKLAKISFSGGIYDILLVAFSIVIHKVPQSSISGLFGWGGYLCVFQWQFFIYFAFGILVKKHFTYFEKLLDNRYFLATVIPVFFIAFIFRDMRHALNYLICFLGIIILFATFRYYQDTFSKRTITGKVLQFIGVRTLDVYFLHYFFLPYNLSIVGKWLEQNSNPTLELFIMLTIVVMTVSPSLLIGTIIRMSQLLGWLTLGTKLNK